jgi:cytochrome c
MRLTLTALALASLAAPALAQDIEAGAKTFNQCQTCHVVANEAVGAAGAVWDEASFVEYVQDPAKFLKAKLGDDKAKSKMAFKLKKPEDAANVWAFITSLAPAPAATN